MGESGSGKSTLAYGASRLLRPPARDHRRQRPLPRPPDRRRPVDILQLSADQLLRLRWREIAIVFQSAMNALNPVLRVADQLARRDPRAPALSGTRRREKAAALLDLVGIPRARLRSYPHELSGGMRQRVMIAMALATDPEVVIMDEPTTALDVVVQREILGQILELKERLGFAILFITHDLSLLLELADRIAVMYAGRARDRPRAGDPCRAWPPVHQGPAQLVPVAARPAAGADRHPRLPARPAHPAARLPVPAPLPDGTDACADVEMRSPRSRSSADPAT